MSERGSNGPRSGQSPLSLDPNEKVKRSGLDFATLMPADMEPFDLGLQAILDPPLRAWDTIESGLPVALRHRGSVLQFRSPACKRANPVKSA